jgi:hypothetical protein
MDRIRQMATRTSDLVDNVNTVSCIPTATAPGRTVLERFPAGAPRGSWPAEQFAHDRRMAGEPAEVVMDLRTDSFLVVVNGGAR